MNTVLRAVSAPAGGPGWAGRDSGATGRRMELTGPETRALGELGVVGLRSRACGAACASLWDILSGLVEPLDQARARLHHPNEPRYRRASRDAAGLILAHCAKTGRSYWGFTAWDWARLCGASTEEFLTATDPPSEVAVRPLLIALAHQLGRFTDFQHLGTFNRVHLARLVYGAELVEASLRQVGEVLDQWGYCGTHTKRWGGALCQALLINRSPRLEELTTGAFERLWAHPATGAHHNPLFYMLQRVVAALGHCDPPVRAGHRAAPVIEGADPRWTGWVQRWYATSTLTRRSVPSSVSCWPRPGGGWRPNTLRSPSPANGLARPAPPGSRR